MTNQPTTHTPGPWALGEDADGAFIVGSDASIVAVVPDATRDRDPSNTALMVAAPDMLAALNRVTEALFNDAVNGHALPKQAVTREQLGELYEIARAAIAKAEGR